MNRQYAATSYSDADAVTRDFKPLCRGNPESCLNGIPAAWFAQTAFGKYHGGLNGNYLLPAMEYGMIPGIKIPGKLATFSLDMRKNFDDAALEKVTESFKKVLKNIGNKPDLSYLVYNQQVAKSIREANAKCGGKVPQCGFSLQDAINNKNAYDFIARALSTATDIDPEVAKPVHLLCVRMSNVLAQIIDAYQGSNRKPSEVIPKELEQTSPGLLAMIAMALDFYAKEPYRQPFKST